MCGFIRCPKVAEIVSNIMFLDIRVKYSWYESIGFFLYRAINLFLVKYLLFHINENLDLKTRGDVIVDYLNSGIRWNEIYYFENSFLRDILFFMVDKLVIIDYNQIEIENSQRWYDGIYQ